MAIQANFNKLIWLKKFNNYFNRKILGSNELKNYFSGTQEDSGSVMEAQQVFTEISIFDFVSADSFIIKAAVEDVPIGIGIGFTFDLDYTATGTITYLYYEYNKDKRIITFYFSTTVVNQADITSLTLTVDFTYTNREFVICDKRNFSSNDDVMAEVVENDLPFNPDYLLVLDPVTNEIITRWFVLKHERTRGNQYHYGLKRDVIYDRLEELMEAPIYVHKGMLNDSDPFVVNDEGMIVNKIKTKETRLLDKSKVGWIVLYLAKNMNDDKFGHGYQTVTTIKISKSATRLQTYDCPYDIAAIPFLYNGINQWETFKIRDTDNSLINCDSYYVTDAIADLIQNLDAECYDVQYLPYCPVPADILVANDGVMTLNNLKNGSPVEGEDFDYIMMGANKVGAVFYIEMSNFSASLSGENGVEITTNLTKKESSNLQSFRLVSPNYQGTFDISLAKNTISQNKLYGFVAYCTYKPYTPFIKVAPAFNFLYGSNFDDARGLICGGDFSFPRTTDAWETYQLNNKNYQNIFNREIQNLEFNQSIEMRNQIINAVVGHFAATAAGAATGAMVGGWVGAIVGGAVAGTASLVGGVVDTITLHQQQREQKSLMIDKYNYQLGNIQALPYTLTQVGCLNAISKVFPFVEEYNCTTKELEAFRNKIKYESMTVLRIDTIYNYYNRFDELCYFKGELIRCDELAEETYFFDAVYAELMKGVFF